MIMYFCLKNISNYNTYIINELYKRAYKESQTKEFVNCTRNIYIFLGKLMFEHQNISK